MTTKRKIQIIVALVVAIFCVYWYEDEIRGYPAPWAATSTAETAGIANPASTNCVGKLGGTLEIKDEVNGQVGYCHLKDGRVCEEWALFRDGSCTASR